MCGICGFNRGDPELIKKMANAMNHRGPDQEGYHVDDSVSLGHKRLSIIDLSENGKQPMYNENRNLSIIFNGEIYNFQKIKKELEEKGHMFQSHSDTEVVIHSYEEWGENCTNYFNGMWAFCIYDEKNKKLFLSRDRFGKKPLYYYNKDKNFIFGSEIKSLLPGINKELNPVAISSFLSYRYVLGEETFFKDIFKLLPAHNLVYNLDSKKIEKNYSYWDIPLKKIDDNFDTAKSKIEELLNSSVNYRKISDVPLGVILSGGLDSSLVAAVLSRNEKNPINTFTVKFLEEGFDETSFARIVSEKYGTKHFEVTIDSSNFLEVMKEYIKYKDEPIGVPNEVPLYLLSKKIREKVTVVLSGEGADELFEGYGRIFSSAKDYELIKSLKGNAEKYKSELNSLYKKYNRKFFPSELEHFLSQYNYWTEDEKELILKSNSKKDFSNIFNEVIEKYPEIPYSQKISYLFLKLHLPGLLNRLDSPTMAASIEARAPFLDYPLAEYVFNLPSDFKTRWAIDNERLVKMNKTSDEFSENQNTSKFILKEVAKDYLPLEIIQRKKQGFPLPLDKWFKGNFFEVTKEFLLSDNSKIKGAVNQENLNKWIEENKESGSKFGQKLWMLLSLELWLREWFPEM